ncbi:hypothetical protein RRG08_023828 [Elysia crispata]|uniref:Uncharacterized protein n=1 Tax=Elysia crispata TaxID=231223 RepID=A0AAE1DMR4_9GAST|nr:hypothetical protein RRG08_023828 [Elysia crispata]
MKQGCVLALVLFNLFFIQALLWVVKHQDIMVYIRNHHDGSLFNLLCLSVRTKNLDKLILEALFAMIVPIWHTGRERSLSIAQRSLFQPAPANLHHQQSPTEMCRKLKVPGSIILADRSLDKEITSTIQKASQALVRL